MDEEKLIEVVRHYENLYNPIDKNYRNHNMKKETWKEIGDKLGVSGNECKDTWTKLRNAFTNARKRRKTISGQEVKNLMKWKFEDQMSFLLPTLQTRRTRGNTPHPEEEEKYYEEVDSNRSFSPNTSSSNLQSTSNSIFELTPSIEEYKHEQKEKKRRIDNTANEILSIMKENQRMKTEELSEKITGIPTDVNYARDETEMFFLSLGRSVKNLSPIEQTKVKMEISNIVFQAELRDLQATGDN